MNIAASRFVKEFSNVHFVFTTGFLTFQKLRRLFYLKIQAVRYSIRFGTKILQFTSWLHAEITIQKTSMNLNHIFISGKMIEISFLFQLLK